MPGLFETALQYLLVQGLRPKCVERTAVRGHARLLAHLGTSLLPLLGTSRTEDVTDSLSGVWWLVGKGIVLKRLRDKVILPMHLQKENVRAFKFLSYREEGCRGGPEAAGGGG